MYKKFLILAIVFSGLFVFIPKAYAAQAHPPGTLINSSGTIWRISDDGLSRKSIDSEAKFYSHRFHFTNVVPANPGDKTLVDAGILDWGDGVLFSYNQIIYQVSQGTRHGFISADVFLGQGFRFDMTRTADLSRIPEGTPIRSASSRHLPGTLLSDSSGTVWMMHAGIRKAFPSQAVFFSNGGLFNQVVSANAADSAEPTGVMNYRTGSLVNDNGTVWATHTPGKIGFPSAACFLNFGFSFGMVISGDTRQLNAEQQICADPVISEPGITSSYSTQSINTSAGAFTARVASFNLTTGKIRVITDTAADRDCADDCATASLKAYTQANGTQSGMNGTYFCPQDYVECTLETNAFFWKVIDTKLGKIINQNNGLGEEDPFLTFDAGGQARYFHTWREYMNSGYSTVAGINSPSMIENGNISLNYAKLDDKQKTTKSIRSAVAIKGQTLYLIQVLNATIPDTTLVLKAMGVDHALNMDGGGSAAMIYNGEYKTGPGRNIPNAILVQELQ